MNWFQIFLKIAAVPIKTQDVPSILAKAFQYEIGGVWKAGPAKAWTEDLEKITGDKTLGQEVGYSTSFWVSCEEGDGISGNKWGVSVTFTVTSGSSNTEFDSETGGWDFSICLSVQWADPESWTPQHPYALLIKSVGEQKDIPTIQAAAQFVKQCIVNYQRSINGDDDDSDDGDDDDPVFDQPDGSFDLVPSDLVPSANYR